jgi:outer membrane biosynthesis protein TonB
MADTQLRPQARRRARPGRTLRPAALALAAGLGAVCCGGAHGASPGAVEVPQPAVAASTALPGLEPPPNPGSAATVRDAGAASPSSADDLASANARWLPACAPAQPGRPPVVRVGDAGQGAALEPVRRVLRRDASAEVARCAAEARKGQPKLEGVVLMRFVVTAEGALSGASVLVSPGDDALHACLASAIERPKVPKIAEGNTTVSGVPVVLCADGRVLLWPDGPTRP